MIDALLRKDPAARPDAVTTAKLLADAATAARTGARPLGDGWLASFITPAEAAAGRAAIKSAAAEAGREVEEDHYGISLAVAPDGNIPDALIAAARQRRPDADPASLVATSWPDARRVIEAYVAAGLTKVVVRPAGAGPAAGRFLDQFVSEMLPLQT